MLPASKGCAQPCPAQTGWHGTGPGGLLPVIAFTKPFVHHEVCFCSMGCHSSADAPCRRRQHLPSKHLACRYATNAVVPVDDSDTLIPTASGLVSAPRVSGTWRAAAAAPACYPGPPVPSMIGHRAQRCDEVSDRCRAASSCSMRHATGPREACVWRALLLCSSCGYPATSQQRTLVLK